MLRVMIGDQAFTDLVGGRGAGMMDLSRFWDRISCAKPDESGADGRTRCLPDIGAPAGVAGHAWTVQLRARVAEMRTPIGVGTGNRAWKADGPVVETPTRPPADAGSPFEKGPPPTPPNAPAKRPPRTGRVARAIPRAPGHFR